MKKLEAKTILGTFFGVGFMPFAPGTFGTLAALLIYFALPTAVFEFAFMPYFLGALLLLSVLGVWICGIAEKSLGHDAPAIVFDEVIGYFVAVFLLPKSIMIGLLAFALFRFFDILKPYPINKLQNLKGGMGVMADDILAGIYANILLQIIWNLSVIYGF